MLSLACRALNDVGARAAVYNGSARSRRTPIATQTLSNRTQRGSLQKKSQTSAERAKAVTPRVEP